MAQNGSVTTKTAANERLQGYLEDISRHNFRPVIAIQYSFLLTREQYLHVSERLQAAISSNGWICLVLDNMSESRIDAFGIPGEKMKEFEEMKKLFEESKNTNA